MTADAAIRVQGLQKSYKDLHVLRDVDFDVACGSIFALLGSNGAGKTTVVRILSTLLKADAGTASVAGFDVAKQPAKVRESISLTGQFAAVDEILSGRENLVLVARLRHLNNAGKIADDLLARFQLSDAGHRKVATYSGGMRRRLDIAMSLIGNPRVIFLDEPTTGLDPEARIEVWDTVKDLAGRGTTVLLTTQYLEEAEHLADRIAILHLGRIIVNGTLAELKQLLPPAKVEYVLFAYELQRRLSEVDATLLSVACHPGWAATNMGVEDHQRPLDRLVHRLTLRLAPRAAQGARSVLFAATSSEVSGGDYIGPSGPFRMSGAPAKGRSSKRSYDPDLAHRLWEVSEAMTGVRYAFATTAGERSAVA